MGIYNKYQKVFWAVKGKGGGLLACRKRHTPRHQGNYIKKYKKVENRLRNTRKRLKGSRKETSSPAHKSRTVRVKFAK